MMAMVTMMMMTQYSRTHPLVTTSLLPSTAVAHLLTMINNTVTKKREFSLFWRENIFEATCPDQGVGESE